MSTLHAAYQSSFLHILPQTGTLTEDGLNLWGVIPSLNGRFADPQFEPSELPRGPLLESMAACHSLTLIENVLSGDPLDLQMFQSTKWVSQFINQLISSLIRAMGAYLPSRYASIDFIGISQARAYITHQVALVSLFLDMFRCV